MLSPSQVLKGDNRGEREDKDMKNLNLFSILATFYDYISIYLGKLGSWQELMLLSCLVFIGPFFHFYISNRTD